MESPAHEKVCLKFLRVLPGLYYKKYVSSSANRNMFHFNRPAGGVSSTARLQIR